MYLVRLSILLLNNEMVIMASKLVFGAIIILVDIYHKEKTLICSDVMLEEI